MQHIARMIFLLFAPLLAAAMWMDQQPSYRAYDAPVLTAPTGSVPFSSTAIGASQASERNPVPTSAASQTRGKQLFGINCSLCHGQDAERPGPVGIKLVPPPPVLDRVRMQGLNDAVIFGAITDGFGRMPSFRNKLSVRERWDLVNYLRGR